MLTRRDLFRGAAALPGGSARRPNLLWIIADDHAAYVLGADGNRQARTPNLDRLAREGVWFARHYCNAPVCTPSRQSFLTGQMPHAAGVTVLRTPLAEDKPTLAKQLRAAGYHTAVFGKMHFNRPARPGLHGFDLVMTEDAVRRAWQSEVRPKPLPEGVRTRPPWRPFKDPARIWLNADKLPYPGYHEDMLGTYIARRAVQYLQEHRDTPFALWVSFTEPHSPFDFPLEDCDLFDPREFKPPRVGPEDGWQIPLIFRDLTERDKQGIIAAYYTSVAYLDRNVGLILDSLRRLGLDRHTLVIYMGDNGYCLGHHGRFEKHTSYEPAIRIPLIMSWPGRIRHAVVRDLTEAVDVAPTVLDLLEVEPLPVQHGRSLRPYLEGGRPARPRDHIFSEYLENEEACVRTTRYKLVFCSGRRERQDGYKTDNPTPGRWWRLYDLERDPGEFQDVSRRRPEVVDGLLALMLERFRKTHPEAPNEPPGLSVPEAIEFYLRPRDG